MARDPHTRGESSRPYSVFDFDAARERGLAWILEVTLCWYECMGPNECAERTGSDYESVVQWFDHCSSFFKAGPAGKQGNSGGGGRSRKR